jgi:hypothetical protein
MDLSLISQILFSVETPCTYLYLCNMYAETLNRKRADIENVGILQLLAVICLSNVID